LGHPAQPPDPAQIHPALNSFADECRAMLMHLAALSGGSGAACHHWYPSMGEIARQRRRWACRQGWLEPGHPLIPAFAADQFDSYGKTETYEIFRHPEGDRKDVLRWPAPGEKPVAELEIDRPGDEASEPVSAIAARMDPKGRRELEAAGVIDSRFGPVTTASSGGRGKRCGIPSWLHQTPR
jgi:succinate dehydrogenase flavin-adding protein (antitoxin of CptAB toxin-antitoxin module)